LTNGSTHSAINDSLDSPPVNHSTPFNSTLNSTGSVSLLETSQETSNSTSSTPSNTSGSAAPKPKKLLPWMAELKQTQDKKRTSNIFNASSSPSSATSPASLPPVVSSSSTGNQIKEKEPVPTPTPAAHTKAPPLPAKPTSLSTSSSTDKASVVSPSGLSNTVNVTTGSAATAPIITTNRTFSMNKKPAPVTPALNNHVNSVHDSNASGDSKQQFVPYEDYAKLRDRVSVLESELEILRRQVKMLMDRDSSHGHIV